MGSACSPMSEDSEIGKLKAENSKLKAQLAMKADDQKQESSNMNEISMNEINKLRCYKQINLTSFRQNMEAIQRMVTKTGCEQIAVLKANAYGHGAKFIGAECLKFGIKTFGLATIGEAIQLRTSSNEMRSRNVRMIVLGASVPDEYELYEKYNIDLMLSSPEMTQTLIEWCQNERTDESKKHQINLHLMMDTGMARIGFQVEDCLNSIRLINKEGEKLGLKFKGLCSHFAFASDEEYTLKQFGLVTSVLTKLEEEGINVEMFHVENSKTLMSDVIDDKVVKSFLDKDTKGYARTGSAIYGAVGEESKEECKRLVSLHARIRHIEKLQKGESVGYDRAFVAEEDVVIATLSIGYADGYPFGMTSKKQVVRIGDDLYDIAGRVAMDMFMVNLGNLEKNPQIKDIKVGDYACLFGPKHEHEKNITVTDLCKIVGGYNAWDIICGLTNRVPAVYVE